jgi:hypothetical protein
MLQHAIRERPEGFRINSAHPRYQTMLFGNFGRHPRTTLYYDDSPTQTHGTLTGFTGAGNTPDAQWQWNTYLRRRCLTFDGVGDYVLFPGTFPLIGCAKNCTITGWFQFLTYGSTRKDVFQSSTSVTDRLMVIYREADYIGINTYDGVTLRAWGNTFTGNDYNWHHFAATVKSDKTLGFYLDGVAGTTRTYRGGFSARASIGADQDVGFYSNIRVADIRAFSEVLPLEEIQRDAAPDNVMLSGLLLPPKRRAFAASAQNRGWIAALMGA